MEHGDVARADARLGCMLQKVLHGGTSAQRGTYIARGTTHREGQSRRPPPHHSTLSTSTSSAGADVFLPKTNPTCPPRTNSPPLPSCGIGVSAWSALSMRS